MADINNNLIFINKIDGKIKNCSYEDVGKYFINL